ncbi:putative cationic amino acid transporter [Penaeus vannamei]|uniref:Putative cationic amino acid transporter n=1 Tax=Penaeus vannamei TaxID=6689 RepID=A0A3R7PIS6_PENVA|nr:putative cationic amino acid transporter [Penaeus vannamei]
MGRYVEMVQVMFPSLFPWVEEGPCTEETGRQVMKLVGLLYLNVLILDSILVRDLSQLEGHSPEGERPQSLSRRRAFPLTLCVQRAFPEGPEPPSTAPLPRLTALSPAGFIIYFYYGIKKSTVGTGEDGDIEPGRRIPAAAAAGGAAGLASVRLAQPQQPLPLGRPRWRRPCGGRGDAAAGLPGRGSGRATELGSGLLASRWRCRQGLSRWASRESSAFGHACRRVPQAPRQREKESVWSLAPAGAPGGPGAGGGRPLHWVSVPFSSKAETLPPRKQARQHPPTPAGKGRPSRSPHGHPPPPPRCIAFARRVARCTPAMLQESPPEAHRSAASALAPPAPQKASARRPPPAPRRAVWAVQGRATESKSRCSSETERWNNLGFVQRCPDPTPLEAASSAPPEGGASRAPPGEKVTLGEGLRLGRQRARRLAAAAGQPWGFRGSGLLLDFHALWLQRLKIAL